jgi:hypothetical protein
MKIKRIKTCFELFCVNTIKRRIAKSLSLSFLLGEHLKYTFGFLNKDSDKKKNLNF